MIIKNGTICESIPFKGKKGRESANFKTIHTKILTEPILSKSLKLRTGNEQAYIYSILNAYPEVFRQEPGRIHRYECRLYLKNDAPIRANRTPSQYQKSKHSKGNQQND